MERVRTRRKLQNRVCFCYSGEQGRGCCRNHGPLGQLYCDLEDTLRVFKWENEKQFLTENEDSQDCAEDKVASEGLKLNEGFTLR